MKYKKTKPQPIVGFPLTKTFNEVLAIDLKEWSHYKKIWFLHITDHVSRYSLPSIIRTKKRYNCQKDFPTLDELVDNEGVFANEEFKTFCENLNSRVCTTVTESRWSVGLVERHKAVLGVTVSKTTEETSCDLDVAVASVVSAKNSLKKY